MSRRNRRRERGHSSGEDSDEETRELSLKIKWRDQIRRFFFPEDISNQKMVSQVVSEFLQFQLKLKGSSRLVSPHSRFTLRKWLKETRHDPDTVGRAVLMCEQMEELRESSSLEVKKLEKELEEKELIILDFEKQAKIFAVKNFSMPVDKDKDQKTDSVEKQIQNGDSLNKKLIAMEKQLYQRIQDLEKQVKNLKEDKANVLARVEKQEKSNFIELEKQRKMIEKLQKEVLESQTVQLRVQKLEKELKGKSLELEKQKKINKIDEELNSEKKMEKSLPLLSEKQETQLQNNTSFDITKLKLLFKGSRDGFIYFPHFLLGFRASMFHKLCDSSDKTLVIVRSSDVNVFGGYATVSWGMDPRINGGSSYAEESWLFGFAENGCIEKLGSRNQYSVFQMVGHGPCFGCAPKINDGLCMFLFSSYDLEVISDNCNVNSSSQSEIYNTCCFRFISKHFLNGGKKNFKVLDYEVYEVK